MTYIVGCYIYRLTYLHAPFPPMLIRMFSLQAQLDLNTESASLIQLEDHISDAMNILQGHADALPYPHIPTSCPASTPDVFPDSTSGDLVSVCEPL